MGTHILGIDIGGSGIKGGLVDITTGSVVNEPHTITTPADADATSVGQAVAQLVQMCGADAHSPIGIGFPAPVVRGSIPYMAHLSPTWVGMNAAGFFEDYLSRPVSVLNDADAAGLAEFTYSQAINDAHTVIFLTLGTGIGSALFVDGKLFPNTELGHVFLKGDVLDAETFAAASARIRDNLSLEQWAERLQKYLEHIENIFNPDAFILGGGISKHFDMFAQFLSTRALVLPATLRNHAGIVGAARYAYENSADLP